MQANFANICLKINRFFEMRKRRIRSCLRRESRLSNKYAKVSFEETKLWNYKIQKPGENQCFTGLLCVCVFY